MANFCEIEKIYKYGKKANNQKQLLLTDLKEGDEAHIANFSDDDAGLMRLKEVGLHDGIALKNIKNLQKS